MVDDVGDLSLPFYCKEFQAVLLMMYILHDLTYTSLPPFLGIYYKVMQDLHHQQYL